MIAEVAIGEFSRLTYLSVKTLRHYHDVGLLEPASVDDVTGYRRYSVDQVAQAHLIRRLRDLDMPVPLVRDVLAAERPEDRDAAIRAHLERMESELDRTRSVVASLRELLTPSGPIAIHYRHLVDQPVLSRTELVSMADVGRWFDDTVGEFRRLAPGTGPAGATYALGFFEEEYGEVSAFLPVTDGTPGATVLLGGAYAVAEHLGSYDDFDRTYGALGTHVAQRGNGAEGPIREHYLIGSDQTSDPHQFRTEICWPVAGIH